MNSLLQSAIGSILRFLLAGAAGWLVQKGVWTQDAANEYVTAAVIALLAVGWSLWNKYKSRIKFLTALESPAGTDERVIDAQIKTGLGAKLLLWVVLLAALAPSAACGPKTKPALVKADYTLYQTVKAIADAELVLSRAGLLTPAQSLQINEALLPVAKLGKEATQALREWNPGEPVPAQVAALTKELGDLSRVIIDIVAKPEARAGLLEKVALAQQAVLVILTLGVLS